MHPGYTDRLTMLFAGLARRYPWVGSVAVRFYREPGDRSLGHTDGRTIWLNSYWFDRPPAALEAAALEGALHGVAGIADWHDGMIEEPEHLLTHEFGHVIEHALAREPGFIDLRRDLFDEVRRHPERAPTGYCLVDQSECWAETFACITQGAAQTQENPLVMRARNFLNGQRP